MAKLEITLSKDKYEALDDGLKTYYVAKQDGQNYELEGIGSLERALAEEKAKKATKPELVTEIEELRKFKLDTEAAATKAAQDDLEAKGKYEEAAAASNAAWQKRVDDATAERDNLKANLHREAAKTELIKRGVLPDRVDYLATEIVGQTEFELGESGHVLKKKGGIGDAAEFDAMIAEAKTAKPFFFESNGASGSGASGSSGSGNANQITRAQYDANPASYAERLGKGELAVVD